MNVCLFVGVIEIVDSVRNEFEYENPYMQWMNKRAGKAIIKRRKMF